MLRIVGGRFRGRLLKTPAGRATRPTSARVREAVFDILEHSSETAVRWSGLQVLDLYSGTGAFGLEAISRGATHATLVEQDRVAANTVRDNIRTMGAEKACTLLQIPVSKALETLGAECRRFGLVFMDPPYADQAERDAALRLLNQGSMVRKGGYVVMESPVPRRRKAEGPGPEPAEGLELISRRRWGDTEVTFLRHV